MCAVYRACLKHRCPSATRTSSFMAPTKTQTISYCPQSLGLSSLQLRRGEFVRSIRAYQISFPHHHPFLLLKVDPSLTSVSQPLDRDEARTFPAPETLSGDEGSETDGEANEDSRFSPANPNRNPSSVNAQPHRSSDNSDSGTDSQPQPPKLKSKIAPKRKISSDDDEPNHSGTRTNPKPAHTGGTSWQGPRKTVVRKKKF